MPIDKRKHGVEKYFEPSFPVLLEEDVAQLEPACRRVAERIAEVFWDERESLEQAFEGSSLDERDYKLEDILDYLYSRIRRVARNALDEQNFFPELPKHPDGSRWVYWAEEIDIEAPAAG